MQLEPVEVPSQSIDRQSLLAAQVSVAHIRSVPQDCEIEQVVATVAVVHVPA